jgi:hypothetical protein
MIRCLWQPPAAEDQSQAMTKEGSEKSLPFLFVELTK